LQTSFDNSDDVAQSIRDDLIREAVVRMFELSGKPQDNPNTVKTFGGLSGNDGKHEQK